MTQAGLVLEGGATRGVFTSGMLDYLMEKDLYFSYVAGVSAGAAVGAAVGAAAEACAAEADWLPQAVRASAAVRVRASIVIFFFIWVISFVLASAFVYRIRGNFLKTGVAEKTFFIFFRVGFPPLHP